MRLPSVRRQQFRNADAPVYVMYESGSAFSPNGPVMADLGVRGGKVAEIGALSGQVAAERVDCAGLHLLPGVIDSQVHFREPGSEHKEDLQTGAAAAALGGVTCGFETPNTNPTTTTPEQLADKVARAKGRMAVDFAFWVGATPDNAEALPELERLEGAAGVKMFKGSSPGSLLVARDTDVARALAHGRSRVAVHSEDEPRLRERADLLQQPSEKTNDCRDSVTVIATLITAMHA